MKRLKFLLLTVVCVAVLFCVATVTASADVIASGNCGKNGANVTYSLEDNGILTISGTGEMESYASASSAPWYLLRDSITDIVISEGVTSIGKATFFNYDFPLQSVTISASVTKIENNAFWSVSGLKCIIFEGSSEQWNNIDKGHFNSSTDDKNLFCLADGYVNVGEAILDYSKNMLVYHYANSDNIYTLPQGIMIVDKNAFKNSKSLSTVILPEGLKYIGDYAFSCIDSSLRNIYIPSSVSTIDKNAFNYCHQLSDVYYGGSEEQFNSINFGANNSKLKSAKIHYNEKLVEIDGVVYSEDMSTIVACSNQKSDSFVMLSSVKNISEYAFSCCNKIKSISISEDVKTITKNAFANCLELTGIYIPKSVTTIDDSAFLNCSLLSDIYFCGTEKEWNAIEIQPSNYAVWVANIHFNHIHTYGDWQIVEDAKAHETGVKSSKCIECGCEKREGIDIKHSTKKVNRIAPNCSDVGYTAGVYCNDCKKYISGHVEIAKNTSNHVNTKNIAEVPATTEKVGYTEGVYCNDCKKYISGHNEIPKLTIAIGDLDGNGKITAADARLALRASVGLEDLDSAQKKAADTDGDGEIKAADARRILRASVGLEDLKKYKK